MALTTLVSGMNSLDFINAVKNNGQCSRYNNCAYTGVETTDTGAEFVQTLNADSVAATAQYRFSPVRQDVSVGMSGSQLLSILNANYSNLENTLLLKTTVPMLTIRLDDGTGGDNTWNTYFNSKGKHFTSCILYELLNTSGYLTTANLQTISSAGHEIQSHGIVEDINLLSDAEKETALQSTRADIESIVGVGNVPGFSVHGYKSLDLKPFVKKFYKWNCSWWNPTGDPEDLINPAEFDLLQLQSILDTNITLTTALIDAVIAARGWLIYVEHSWSQGRQDILDVVIPYCNTNGVAVVSIKEGIESCVLK